jgi:hypothetical protein
MGSISADNTYEVPKTRTVRLRAAVAVGVAAVAAAFGVGWILADATVAPVAATASEPRAAAIHTADLALTESLALKGRAAESGISDIRKRRVE